MAVVYFTSNASTGAGSLAEAIQNAQPGDVVRPDESVFERGSTIEIVLASTLSVGKNLTLDGGPFRVCLNGGGAIRCASVAANVTAAFVGVDFVGGYMNGVGGGINAPGTTDVTLERCGFYGCCGKLGGGAYTTGTTRYFDCVFSGCLATESGGAIYISKTAELNGVTIAGCVAGVKGGALNVVNGTASAGNSIICGSVNTVKPVDYVGCVVDVAPSQIGFVAAPPDNLTAETWNANLWQNWDLRLLDDASPTPSPYRDAGDVDAATQYDFDGNFRGRETNGAATRSPGAFETIQADLFWVGRDSTGATVATPTFNASDGWATSRFAAVSGDAAPQTGQAFFIGRDVAFADAPPDGSTANVGGGVKVSTGSGAGVSTLNLGVGAVFDVATSVSAGRFGAESLVKLRAGTLTVDGETTTDATEPLRFVRWTGGRLRVVGYLRLLEDLAIPPNATLDLDGATLRVETLTVGDGATVAFSSGADALENDANNATAGVNVDAVLTATQSATVGAATFSGAGYFATPPGTDLTAATFAETVRVVDYSAGVAGFTATATGPTTASVVWSATDATARVCVERENAAAPNGWEVVATTPTEDASPLEVALSGKERFRIFDGATFTVDSAWFPSGDFYVYVADSSVSALAGEWSEWAAITQTIKAGGAMGYRNENIMFMAQVKNRLSGGWLAPSDVVGITATVCRVYENGFAPDEWVPVDGWEGAEVPAECVLETPTPNDAWTADAEGPNFVWVPDVRERAFFPTGGKFATQLRFDLTGARNPIYLTFVDEVD